MKSPEFYRSLIAELPGAAIFVVDSSYRYVIVGGEGIANAGMEAAQFKGRSALEMAPPGLRSQIKADFDAVFAGKTFVREHSAGERYFSTRGKPLYEADGSKVAYALAVSYDVTERKLSELRLSVLEAASTLARQSASEQDVIEDLAGLLRRKVGAAGIFFAGASSYSDATSSMAGLSCDGETGVVSAILACSNLHSCVMLGNTVTAGVGAVTLRYIGYAQVNEVAFDSAVLCPYTDAAGVQGICAVFGQSESRQWRSEEVLLLQELCITGWQAIEKHRVVNELKAAAVKQNRFLAVLGHELRNPLSAMRSALDLLELSKSADHQIRARNICRQQFLQIQRLMDDLTAISQANSPDASYIRTELVDLAVLMENVLKAMQHAFDEKKQTVTTSFERPSYAVIDEVRITQVLNNLLSNAIKYSPSSATIDVALKQDEEHVIIKVTDDGIGMSPETLASIFDMYGRGREALAQAQDGLGVGMWLAKRFVEAHGGTIEAYSEGEGKGSTFTVTLTRRS